MPQADPDGPNPAMLRWARERAGLSLAEAARRLRLRSTPPSTAAERLNQLESGKQLIRESLLFRMAHIYRHPLICFYLNAPPKPSDYGQDFRVLPAPTTPEEDGRLRAIRSSMFIRQSVVRDCLEEDGDSPRLSFIGSVSIEDGIEAVVERVHELLGTHSDSEPWQQTRSRRKLFQALRSRIENLGVFVLIANEAKAWDLKLSCTVFSGLAISDSLAPFIALNGDDPSHAQSFALIHQFVHLLIGTTGVCNAPGNTRRGSDASRMETFCNDVAAEVLVPSNCVVELVGDRHRNTASAEQLVHSLSASRHVDQTTAGYQLFRHRLISRADFANLAEAQPAVKQKSKLKHQPGNRAHPTAQRSTSAPRKPRDRFATQKERLGQPLVQLLRSLLGAGDITYTTAARALGMKAGQAASLLHGS